MTDQQSDTPRTDAEIARLKARKYALMGYQASLGDFTRTLERELNEAKQRIIQLEIDLKDARHQHAQEMNERQDAI